MAEDKPLVLTGWLSLLTLEDLPEFADLTGVAAEHLIQSLLYRLRECGGETRETVKVAIAFNISNVNPARDSFVILFFHMQCVLTHILLRLDR